MTTPAIRQVFAALEARGGEGCVRFVGGCVRDVLMGRVAGDIDLSTQLKPDDTEAALDAAGIRHIPTGKAHGTITAVVDDTPYEITSLREDVETDGRRAVVSFTDDWRKDAQRRDFYLNALYADIRGQVYDPTGQGLSDAEDGRVRFIGDAETRIREDYLRILRFFRFSAGYSDGFDAESLAACVALKDGIAHLSGERIAQEVLRLLGLTDPVAVCQEMISDGVMALAFGGMALSGHLLVPVCALTRDPELRLAGLLYPEGADEAALATFSERLKISGRLRLRLKTVFEHIDFKYVCDESDWVRALYVLGPDTVRDVLILRAARDGLTPEQTSDALDRLGALAVPVFPLRAADLMAAGLKAGPELGQALKHIEAKWLDNGFSQNVITEAVDDIRKRTNIETRNN
ncbi:MAG: CCA tRNA nucleotidyltransferase [Asticcacaulis sp.]